MQAPLQIKVLGELAVVREAQEIVLPASKKTRALLAYLALANRRQRRDHLCQMLWNAPDDPRASLRWSLTKLRRVLNEDGDEPCLRTEEMGASRRQQAAVSCCTCTHYKKNALTYHLRLETWAALSERFEGLELPRCPVFEAWHLPF
jgi:DNA-binding SARP family transcriptional activator